MAVGAFDQDLLVGFGVLGHRFMGENLDQLTVDLMSLLRKQSLLFLFIVKMEVKLQKQLMKSFSIRSQRIYIW